ncbi:EEIG1/EHBP1 N-terminal domain [Macleaya cordata]|uniref:EEIG1/EHBP1 N-terminal domain n=1 Tax=Macleaya cordata TaxID=56857 RepID=A0A200PNU2_MACCD|nr:EEIG1/EHBP1 N-terminal domain [Macleaya cordata]
MVVRMMKWSPWPPVSNSKKFQVKVKPLKLQGCNFNGGFEENEDQKEVVVVEMKWKGPKVAGLASALRRSANSGKNISAERIILHGFDIEFDDEFETVCNFSVFPKDNSLIPFDVSFNLLHGQSGELKNKLAVIGTVSLNLAELASQMEPQIERKLPITLQVAGIACEATLLISVSFVEMRTDSVEIVQDTTESDKEGFLRKVKDLTGISKSKKKKKKKKIEGEDEDETSDGRDSNRFLGDTDESTPFDSDGSPDNNLAPIQTDSEGVVAAKEEESLVYDINDTDKEAASLVTQLGTSTTQLDSVSKVGFWKKRKLSFRSGKKKEEPLIEKTKSDVDQRLIGSSSDDSVSSKEITKDKLATNSNSNDQQLPIGDWDERVLISRDNQTKLETNVFFASMDQRSEKAAGESACTALVAVIADWLQSNPNKTPTLSEFDNLITEGSSEWRKLCENQTYIQNFPDKHFDLETVLEAKIRPLYVRSDKSFIGFFCPESFESLKGAMSFDGIWDEISSSNIEENDQPKVFIVSWNDHFFVLKVEKDCYYLIDTLGERLFEGCNQAYILKFDDSSTMYSLPKKTEMEKKDDDDDDDENKEITINGDDQEISICSGKECCREFIKRFLAAIPLRELEIEEKKGTLSSVVPLHQRLQIEFHFSSSSSSFSSS